MCQCKICTISKISTIFKTALLFLLLQNQTSAQPKPDIQHATTYKPVDDISMYWVSEKLDGIRGYWNGKQLLTRQGNLIHSPKWFTLHWPKNVMDGELWIARDNFQATLSCVRKVKIEDDCWQKVRYMIFDLPAHSKIFTLRIKTMTQLVKRTNSPYLAMIKQFKLNNTVQLENKLNSIIAHKGEGLMLHRSNAYYHVGKTTNIMKLKKHQDAEATVIAHVEGKGKYTGQLGAVKVKMPNGIVFKIGSGFSDAERANPPAVGSVITYKYNGKTKAGIPRFARFFRVKTVPKNLIAVSNI